MSTKTMMTKRRFAAWTSTALMAGGLAVLGACGGGDRPTGEPVLTTDAGAISWKIWLEPNPAEQEGTHLWLEVRDEAGEPVEDAEVEAGYFMPAMGAMAEMRGTGMVRAAGEGWYDSVFDFPMAGSWTIDVAVRSDTGSGTAEYTLTTGTKGLRQTSVSGSGGTAGLAPPGAEMAGLKIAPLEYPEPALEALRTALAAYEEARALLAADRLDGLGPRSERLAASLEMASAGLDTGPGSAATRCLEEAATAARSMGEADSLGTAREAFGEVSRFLIVLADADPRLAEGWHVFECPMAETVPKWMQPTADLGNPYMGQAMSTCGEESDWTVPAPAGLAEAQAHADQVHGGDIAYYTCSMHPSVQKDAPGTCPICSMDLTPVTREEVETGTIVVDAQRRQHIGVRTAPVSTRRLEVAIRAVGEVVADETREAEISVKYPGWIGRLHVDETGQEVKRGQTLFTLYSPELLAAQEDLLTAIESQRRAAGTGAPDRADYLVEAARRRLSLWDLSDAQIDRITATGEPLKYVPILSPVSGFVIEKNVVTGASVQPGQTLFRLAALDRVWVEAEVYESELPLVEVGQRAQVTFPYLPGKRIEGEVTFVSPVLRPGTRTGTVRVELANPSLALKPEMYANVILEADRGEALVVPEEAVVYSGPRRIVFVDLGEGRLEPREIEIGMKTGDAYEVLSGLAPGDVVVISGNFLIAAESRLKSATGVWK